MPVGEIHRIKWGYGNSGGEHEPARGDGGRRLSKKSWRPASKKAGMASAQQSVQLARLHTLMEKLESSLYMRSSKKLHSY